MCHVVTQDFPPCGVDSLSLNIYVMHGLSKLIQLIVSANMTPMLLVAHPWAICLFLCDHIQGWDYMLIGF